jgi:pimeloyl-ACP methyl ester carboxylesterase
MPAVMITDSISLMNDISMMNTLSILKGHMPLELTFKLFKWVVDCICLVGQISNCIASSIRPGQGATIMKTANQSPVTPHELQTVKPRSRIWTWLKRALLGLLIFTIALMVVGATYQVIATNMDQRNYAAPGQLVDVGNYRLHIHCTGTNNEGNPTVILEQGLGGISSAWALIQPEVAKATRVCSYDRAGMGWSDLSPEPRDAQHIAAELHTLLQNANIPGTYVLVGWSFGGLYARQYAGQYPDEVTGLVLLDSSHPDQWTSTPEGQAQFQANSKIYSVSPALARLGVMRVVGSLQPALNFPMPYSGAIKASFAASKDWDAQSAEFLASPATMTQVNELGSLGNTPLFVLTATEHGTPPEQEQLWQNWQTGLAALSTNSLHQIVEGADHASFWLDAETVKVSIDAILQVLEAARTGQPLAQK